MSCLLQSKKSELSSYVTYWSEIGLREFSKNNRPIPERNGSISILIQYKIHCYRDKGAKATMPEDPKKLGEQFPG